MTDQRNVRCNGWGEFVMEWVILVIALLVAND